MQSDGEAPDLLELRRRGNTLLHAGLYQRAIHTYENGYEQAMSRRNRRSAVRFLNNLGSAYYELFRYRDAMQMYLKARDLAISLRDLEMLGALYNNLSSLYFDMGEMDLALESVEKGLQLPSGTTAKFTASLLLQSARIKERQKDLGQRILLLQKAIEVSRKQLDMASEAQAWNELGNAFLGANQFQSAERALLEAFRLRKLTHDERLYFSYESLGRLRSLQGDQHEALTLLDGAVDSARFLGPSAMWGAYYERGKVRLAQGLLGEAFADFGSALESVRNWRAEVLPADVFRVSSEVEVHQIYSSYIEAGNRLYERTGEKRWVKQTFAAAEENRAASLRALWAGRDFAQSLPPEYWDALADLHKAEVALVKHETTKDDSVLRQLRLRIAEIEARAGLDLPRRLGNFDSDSLELLRRVQRALQANEVFFSFHLGNGESCMWVIAPEGFEFRRLPAETYFLENIRLFVEALRDNSPQAKLLGSQLYSRIFGGASKHLIDKPLWMVAPDGPLFDMPFAALVEEFPEHTGMSSYLVERHAVQIVPGIGALIDGPRFDMRGPMVGLGDPIYNRADPRLSGQRNWIDSQATLGSVPGAQHLELARLVGSGREIESCANLWRSHGIDPILLRGAAANRKALSDALRRNPTVLHMAAHILFPPQQSGLGFLALSLQQSGDVDLLSATEIASMRVKLALVVLDGCSSGHAAILPGAGLMGMTRAWLAAGAHAVIATRWAMADQVDSEIFASFYDSLHKFRFSNNWKSLSQLLQQAQISELKAGGRRANPAHWAAYFCVERK